jgi:stage V sporulation protein AC
MIRHAELEKRQAEGKISEYKGIYGPKQPKPPLAKNLFYAFVIGGLICVLGQFIKNTFISLGFAPEQASNPTVAAIIFLGALATGLGFFDNLARVAGAGTAVPVTGFANAITSAAMEFRREGLVLGVGGKMFSLAGSVIVFGVVAAFIVGLLSALL